MVMFLNNLLIKEVHLEGLELKSDFLLFPRLHRWKNYLLLLLLHRR
jgi:hypothetical protein